MLPKLFFAALLFLSTALSAQTPTADNTIVGHKPPYQTIGTGMDIAVHVPEAACWWFLGLRLYFSYPH